MSNTSAINSAATLPANNVVENPVTGSRAPRSTLTQNDFLKLLVAQMSAQDPLNPQSNTDFAAQMAQFSSLQTSQATQSDIADLQASQQVQQANSLIGRGVTLLEKNGNMPTGLVTGVQMVSGVPKIVVNGAFYDLNQVLAISGSVDTQSSGSPTPRPVTPTPTPVTQSNNQLPPQPANPYAL